ncbi:MAG: hypothetical protein LBF86_07065 [Helicobacteraceae bacterium]|nr:hypothetical protein [Helicobacteraceae bacterium]
MVAAAIALAYTKLSRFWLLLILVALIAALAVGSFVVFGDFKLSVAIIGVQLIQTAALVSLIFAYMRLSRFRLLLILVALIAALAVGSFVVFGDFKLSVALVSVQLIQTAALVSLIFAYMKFSRFWLLLILVASVAVPPIGFFTVFGTSDLRALPDAAFKLSVVPDALHVTDISYSKEESWGFGPGGNETGVRAFPLPKQVADEIERRGIEFFNNMPPNKNQRDRDWRGKYEIWRQTPISPTSDFSWKVNEEGRLDIDDYLGVYGFRIYIDPAIVKEANEIINSEGSYYAYGRIGLIIVCPAKRLVLYLYNG